MRRIAFCLAAAGLFAASAASAQTTLRFANFLPGTLAYSPVFTEYAEAVNKEAPAAVKVEMFHGGTLGPNPIQQLKLLQDGVAAGALRRTHHHFQRRSKSHHLGHQHRL